MKGKCICVLCLLCLLCVSCSVDLPSYVIPEGKMEDILYDYHIAQGIADAKGEDVEANRYIYVQKVFEKYDITEEEFDSSMVWYSGHASHLTQIYDRIGKRLERESQAAGLNIPDEDRYARFTTEGDTANIWSGRDIFFLHGNRGENIYTVSIPADSTYRRGDYFMLRFGNSFIAQERQQESFVLMQVRYANDSVVASTSMVGANSNVALNITKEMVTDTCDIKSIVCTFYYAFDESEDDKFRLWAVTKPVLLRYHDLNDQQAEEDSLPKDSLKIDSLQTDTTTNFTDSMSRSTRMSPDELRESQPVERKINVVEKRRVKLPNQPQRVKPSR